MPLLSYGLDKCTEPSIILLCLILGAFCLKRLLTYVHIYQQEEYDGSRFLINLKARKLFDVRGSASLLLGSLLNLFLQPIWGTLLSCILLLYFVYEMPNPTQQAKKHLVMTPRVQRLLTLNATLIILPLFAMSLLEILWLDIVLIQALPLFMILANEMLRPLEKKIQDKFLKEALEKLTRLNPHVVGVGGSFGKTSTKYFIQHILNSLYPTSFTPGSVNTVMGITKHIRSELQPHHRYLIVEMGAYAEGSIANLCRIFKPQTAVVSALGIEHFERFKSFDAIEAANFELPAYCLTHGGHVITTDQVLSYPKFKDARDSSPHQFSVVGQNVWVTSAENTREGLRITFETLDKNDEITVPIWGRHHAQNIAVALLTALQLGIRWEIAMLALKNLPQVKHRLEVKRQDDGIVWIDDAYNSNPLGFEEALEVMHVMTAPEGRSILVTPGLVELGEKHHEVHYDLGMKAALKADLVIVVAPARIPTFVAAIPQDKRITFEHFHEARAWLLENQRKGDAILLENDLPDLYEDRPKL